MLCHFGYVTANKDDRLGRSPWSLVGVADAESVRAHLQEAKTAARETKWVLTSPESATVPPKMATQLLPEVPSLQQLITEGSGSWRQGLSSLTVYNCSTGLPNNLINMNLEWFNQH